ncbi:unnamed protein product [Dicrocoelium dendriticum]|nr:unnamed protein product [Dicrocoelium dendriticum]
MIHQGNRTEPFSLAPSSELLHVARTLLNRTIADWYQIARLVYTGKKILYRSDLLSTVHQFIPTYRWQRLLPDLKSWSVGTIQHRLAEMKTSVCVSRAFVDRCLELHSQGRLDSELASMAKYWTSDLVNRVAYDAVQMHGGWGYMWEYPVCRTYVDARVQSIYGGSNEIMKELIARSIVKS